MGSEPVYRITAAHTGLTADIHARTRKYLISMGIRTVCFVGAVIAPPPARWFLIVGALVLPWVAVVVANSGRTPSDTAPPVTVHQVTRTALNGPSNPDLTEPRLP
jgi:Protein of unknown function (DUF3099)